MFPLFKRKISGYSWGDTTFYSDKHLGVDYEAKIGDNLYAPSDGEVINQLWGRQGGMTIWFRPAGENIIMRFLHLSEFGKKGKVKRGEIIGKTGNTGEITTNPHLHLDISKNQVDVYDFNNFINPEEYNFMPNKFKVKFVLNNIPYKDKILKAIERAYAFYGQNYWDMDWSLGETNLKFSFVDFPPYRGINWDDLLPLLREEKYKTQTSILCFFYEAGKEEGLANFTGKFPEGAVIQMPSQEFFFDGNYGFWCLVHELCHALSWIETRDKSVDTLDAQVVLVDTEEEKLKIVQKEILELYKKKLQLTIVERLLRKLVELRGKLGF
jgi:hypothetical protein